jgi:hypothetical protein
MNPCLEWADVFAHAIRDYSDPARFAEPSVDGGGGGRAFTASRLDGHGCDVCHSGGAAPRFEVTGWRDDLEAGVRHDLAIRWVDVDAPHALDVELLDANGLPIPIELPVGEAIPAAMRCDADPDGDPAAVRLELPGGRDVVAVSDCGARELVLSFVADVDGPYSLTLSGVRSNSDGTYDGDGVGTLRLGAGTREDAGCRQDPGFGAWAPTSLLSFSLLAVIVLVSLVGPSWRRSGRP